MRTPTLVKDYSRLSDNNLEFRAEAIAVSLADNPNFKATIPTLANFTRILAAFTSAMENINTGDRVNIAIKNQAREDLITSMKQLALNIESITPGDRAKLISSGFEIAADGDGAPSLEAPQNFKLREGKNPGEIISSVQGVPNAVSYMHEYTEDPIIPESRWISKVSSMREHTFKGLRSGLKVHVRVAVIGRKGQEVYSNTLTRIVQ
ncbi:MAG: hypothetical protein ACYCZO_08675 [Daejeonella sp.]